MKHKRSIKVTLLAVVLLVALLVPSVVVNADEPSWTALAPMSEARALFNTQVIDGKIYALGGSGLSTMEVYDPSIDTWTTVSPMPSAKVIFNTEVIDGKIYAIGGYGSGYYSLSSAEVYNPGTDTWANIASMSAARTDFQTEVIDGKIYAIGGEDVDLNDLSSAEVYDPGTDTWTTLASMSEARCFFHTAVIDGKIYAIGGRNAAGSAEVYDPGTDTWSTLAAMSTNHLRSVSAVIDGKIYVTGGIGTASVEVYDPGTDTWTTLTSMPIAKAFAGKAIVNGKIYVIGGRNEEGTGDLASVEVYDPGIDTWTTLSPISAAREHIQVQVLDGTIYAMGGYEGTVLSLVECYTPASAPGAPANLITTAGDTQVDLSWDTASGADSYTVMRSTVSSGTYTTIATDLTTTAYTDTDVTNGTTYYYVIVAVNGEGDSPYSSEASATPIGSAALTAATDNAQVDLTWDAVSGADSYTVKRATVSGGPYTDIAAGLTATAYTDTDVTNGTTYYYVVAAVNGEDSTYSNEATATPTYNALLRITMVTGEIKEYEMDGTDIEAFLSWCNSEGEGSPSYRIVKDYNLGPFSVREEYIVYDKIANFEVLTY